MLVLEHAAVDGRRPMPQGEPMKRLPDSRIGKLDYLERRVGRWDADPAAIGLASAQSAAAVESAQAARAAYKAMIDARRTAEAMHDAWLGAMKQAENDGRSCLRSIDAFARNSPQPDAIYARASVEPPGDKHPLGPPHTPPNLAIAMDTQGRANLAWGGTRHGGTVYQVQRRTIGMDGNTSPWATVATVAERRFVDQATPSGVRGVSYRVRGQRPGGASAYTLPVTLPLGAVAPSADAGASSSGAGALSAGAGAGPAEQAGERRAG